MDFQKEDRDEKKLIKKKMKTFAKKSISTVKSSVSVRKKHFGNIFVVDGKR